MSVITDVADSVVTELNAASLSLSFTAKRYYMPRFDLKDMKDLHVSVVPKGTQITKNDRIHNIHDISIDIAIQKKFDKGDLPEIDPLLQLAEEIADLFRLRRLSSYPAAHWLKTEHSPIYSQEHWDELREFTSVITLTFRVLR